jgi:hypothetical protein
MKTMKREGFQTVLRAAGETETRQANSKIGLSWMKETLDFSF